MPRAGHPQPGPVRARIRVEFAARASSRPRLGRISNRDRPGVDAALTAVLAHAHDRGELAADLNPTGTAHALHRVQAALTA